jgi:radical SAM superfamily enzyme YgiQ (UPF0313 family)
MKLSWASSGGETQNGENRIGRGRLRLARDPFLHTGQTLGGLVDVVAIGDVGEGFEQLFEALVAGGNRRVDGHFVNRQGAASRYANQRAPVIDLFHPVAFPLASVPKLPKPAIHPSAGIFA